jgi:hypothetical protein
LITVTDPSVANRLAQGPATLERFRWPKANTTGLFPAAVALRAGHSRSRSIVWENSAAGSRSFSEEVPMRYVDVFVSHELEDKQRAERVAALIGSWGFECYLDANDAELDKFYVDAKGRKQRTVQDPAAMAAHIRDSLRTRAGKVHAFGADDFPAARDVRNHPQDCGASQSVP